MNTGHNKIWAILNLAKIWKEATDGVEPGISEPDTSCYMIFMFVPVCLLEYNPDAVFRNCKTKSATTIQFSLFADYAIMNAVNTKNLLKDWSVCLHSLYTES